MTFEDMLNYEPYKSCYEKGFADGKTKGRADAIDEFDKRLDLRIKIGNTVMLMADSKFYEAERKNIYNQAIEDFEKCAIQQSLYTETEEGWSGMTVDTKTIKNIKEQLKK